MRYDCGQWGQSTEFRYISRSHGLVYELRHDAALCAFPNHKRFVSQPLQSSWTRDGRRWTYARRGGTHFTTNCVKASEEVSWAVPARKRWTADSGQQSVDDGRRHPAIRHFKATSTTRRPRTSGVAVRVCRSLRALLNASSRVEMGIVARKTHRRASTTKRRKGTLKQSRKADRASKQGKQARQSSKTIKGKSDPIRETLPRPPAQGQSEQRKE